MATSSKPNNAKQSAAAKPAASAAAPKKPAPVAKAAAKTAAAPAAKAAVKPAAKALPPKASAAAAKASSAPATKPVKNGKPKKAKMIRDSFTMPESEYKLLAEVKARCIARGVVVKKSEVLRAAILGFAAQSDAAIGAALQALDVIKTGRPPKGQK